MIDLHLLIVQQTRLLALTGSVSFHDDDGPGFASKAVVAPPPAELGAQPPERCPFPPSDRSLGQPIVNGQHQVGHSAAGIERQDGAVVVQRDYADARQVEARKQFPGHDDERPGTADGHELGLV
jgi:hypothetical protein